MRVRETVANWSMMTLYVYGPAELAASEKALFG
jgi:hypothetical protein